MRMTFSRQALALVCFLFIASFLPDTAMAQSRVGEYIERFTVDILIGHEGEATVTETIRYRFGSEPKHGIYRDIPVDYVTRLGVRKSIDVTVEQVRDENGRDLTYEKSRSGANLRIKIGDANELVSGTQVYVLRYRVDDALSFQDGFDELYWNATGNEWSVPIMSASVAIQTLEPTKDVRFACYVGPRGSTNRCDPSANRDIFDTKKGVRIDWTDPLSEGSGITVALGFGKGYALEPSVFERIYKFFLHNPFTLVPAIVFGLMFQRWWRFGRDPEGRGTIVPEYDIPGGLSPLHIAALQSGRVTGSAIPAAIIDLAVKGHLQIKRLEKDGLIFDSTDYQFTETARHPEKGTIEYLLVEALFGGSVKNIEGAKKLLASPIAKFLPGLIRRSLESAIASEAEVNADHFRAVKVSELKNKFYARIPELQKQAVQDMVTRKLFEKSPQEVWGKYTLWGVMTSIAALFLVPLLELSGASVVALLITIPIYFGFVYFMPRVTREGSIVKEQLLGLKEYLQIAEKRRLDFHNAPEKTPQLFERLLPAALLLGVSDIWAKEFAGISLVPPEWYHGSNLSTFSAASFADDMGNFNGLAGQSLAAAPSGSGSGGGGSSGGGGGGGGGGSW
ncbi:MAG: DUF2207 domain-containing protein [Undibacterium sp.]